MEIVVLICGESMMLGGDGDDCDRVGYGDGVVRCGDDTSDDRW